MTKYSWSDYCGTQEPRPLMVNKLKRGENRVIAYGYNAGLVRQVTRDSVKMEVYEFGKSNGFYLVCEANSPEQAGFLFRKFLKEAVVQMTERDTTIELDLG
jgi:hypothetical protein